MSSMNDIKVTVLGDGGVGKTALTIQLTAHHFVVYYDPTIESSYRQQFLIDEKVAMLDILDTAGQEEFTALRAQWIRSGEGFVIVFSITSRTSFEECENFRRQILQVKDVDEEDAPPMVLIGNKCDLEEEREVSTEEGENLAKLWGCDFFEASAKNRTNVQESFFTLVRRIRELNGEGEEEEKKPAGGRRTCVLY